MNDHDSELISRANELTATQRSLGQVYDQLANWHSTVVDGVEYNGEDGCCAGCAPGVARAELGLRDAAQFAGIVEDALMQAHNANSVVRWFDSVERFRRLS
jgi:hypothetical protein